uniref:Uncharacterized protein n=1 Tax=Anguilla anguilla TaxID=7936 RepID=A0A0E9UV93_ANGAN
MQRWSREKYYCTMGLISDDIKLVSQYWPRECPHLQSALI